MYFCFVELGVLTPDSLTRDLAGELMEA